MSAGSVSRLGRTWPQAACLALGLSAASCGSRSDLELDRSVARDPTAAAGGPSGNGATGGQSNGVGGSGTVQSPGEGGAGGQREQPPTGSEPPTGPVDFQPGAAGLPPVSPLDCPPSPLSLDQLLSAMVEDQRAQPARARQFLRYLNGGPLLDVACAEREARPPELEPTLRLLLNSLSRQRALGAPQAVPGAAGLFRLDLRDYGWDRPLDVDGVAYRDGWEAIQSLANARLELDGPRANALRQASTTDVAVLLVPDFAHVTLRGELYYELLGLARDLPSLKRALGIAEDPEVQPEAWWRAGTTESRISRQSRRVLRFRGDTAAGGWFWQTLDEQPGSSVPSTFVEPLGMAADVIEALFSLPNGLTGYFLADAAGQRIVETRLLLDTLQQDFTTRVARSCMGCHAEGPIQVIDEVRAFIEGNTAFSPRDRELLLQVYPPQAELDELVSADANRVAQVRRRLGLEPGAVSLAQSYEQDVLPAVAAAELYVSEATLREREGELPLPLRAALSAGSIDRRAFEQVYLETACLLHGGGSNPPRDCP